MTDNQYKNIEQFTIYEAIQNMGNETFVIPSLQRRLVWSNDQMSELFNTIFQNNTFGSLIAIKQTDGKAIFNYYREFVDNRKEADEIMSQEHSLHNIDKENPMYFLLDGQQRLQTFYICLNGKQEDKLYFDIVNGNFSFQKEDKGNAQWIEAQELYDYLKGTGHTYYNYVERIKIEDETKIDKIKENIFKFYYNVFFNKKITMSLVYPDNKVDIYEDKKRFIDLFVKLNTGGTVLNEVDAFFCAIIGYEPKASDIIASVYSNGFEKSYHNILTKVFCGDTYKASKSFGSDEALNNNQKCIKLYNEIIDFINKEFSVPQSEIDNWTNLEKCAYYLFGLGNKNENYEQIMGWCYLALNHNYENLKKIIIRNILITKHLDFHQDNKDNINNTNITEKFSTEFLPIDPYYNWIKLTKTTKIDRNIENSIYEHFENVLNYLKRTAPNIKEPISVSQIIEEINNDMVKTISKKQSKTNTQTEQYKTIIKKYRLMLSDNMFPNNNCAKSTKKEEEMNEENKEYTTIIKENEKLLYNEKAKLYIGNTKNEIEKLYKLLIYMMKSYELTDIEEITKDEALYWINIISPNTLLPLPLE